MTMVTTVMIRSVSLAQGDTAGSVALRVLTAVEFEAVAGASPARWRVVEELERLLRSCESGPWDGETGRALRTCARLHRCALTPEERELVRRVGAVWADRDRAEGALRALASELLLLAAREAYRAAAHAVWGWYEKEARAALASLPARLGDPAYGPFAADVLLSERQDAPHL